MNPVIARFLFSFALLCSTFLAACDQEETAAGPSDMDAADAMDQASEADQVSDLAPGDGTETDQGVEPDDWPWEAVYMIHWHYCPGCVGVPTPYGAASDASLSEMAACPNGDTGVLFGTERVQALIRALPPDTCALLDTESVLVPPEADCMDAGEIDFSADWPEWGGEAGKITLRYIEMLDNYEAVFFQDEVHGYHPGKTIGLHAHGGADIAEFSASATSLEQIELVSPHTDEDGQIIDLPHDQPLTVTWSSQSDNETITLWLNGVYLMSAVRTQYLGCHAANDGEFTIPSDLLAQFEWAQFTTISLGDTVKVELPIPEIDHPVAWTIGTLTMLYINHDPDAQIPPPTERPGYSMSEGQVGLACENDTVCGGGRCLTGMGYFMDGYCSVAECIDNQDCPEDAVCHVAVHPSCPYYSFCAKRCEQSSDCREPYYLCMERDEGQVCLPGIW